MVQSVRQHEIRRGEGLQPQQIKGKVGRAFPVDVAVNIGVIVYRPCGIDLVPAQLATDPADKQNTFAGDKTEHTVP
ncbi:MAG: hypothetical protein JWR75_1213 [Devosia sp.]|nr:hypothetical protein [Devosia sp.]